MRLKIFGIVTASALAAVALWAQTRGGGSPWLTAFGDAQRTSWIPADAAISVDAMAKPGFELQWKVKLENQPRHQNGLGQGVTANDVTIFVPLSLVTGSSNNIYSIDNDTGYVLWQRHFDAALPAATAACPGGITAAGTRLVEVAPPSPTATAARGTAGVSAGYRGSVSEPGQGVVVEARSGGAAAPPPAIAPPAVAPTAVLPPPPPTAAPPTAPIPGIPGAFASAEIGVRRPSGVVYVIASDGVLHVLGLPSGKDMQKPAPFLPPNANWSDPIAVNTTLYTSTSNRCGGVPNGIWAIGLAAANKPVLSWKTNGGSVIGPVALGLDGTLIAAIGPGPVTTGGFSNAIVSLDPKTMRLKDWFRAPGAEFVSAPVIFRLGKRDIVAAATKDGRVLLLDAKSLGGVNHSTPLHTSRVPASSGAFAPCALATWHELAGAPGGPVVVGTRWLLVPTANAITAMRVTDSGGKPTMQVGWVSRDLVSPVTPLIVNGVVFALSSGRPSPAVLYALNGVDGKELWTSGTTITSFFPGKSFWSANGQVYVGAFDGTLYAFGFAMERKY